MKAIEVRPGKPAARRRRSVSRRAYKALVGGLGVVLARAVRVLPVKLAAAAGRAMGIAAYHLSKENRGIALESLAIAFPEKSAAERRRIARESFARVGRSGMEWLAIGGNASWPDRHVKISGTEHVEAARARGKGVLWITGHVGNWELMASAVARAGYPCSVIATTVRYAALNRLSIEQRGAHGVRTIERESPTAGRQLLRTLRANEMIGILADHDTKVPSVQVEFFGRPAWTAHGPAELALKLGAVLLSGFNVREPDGTYRVVIEPAIPLPEGALSRSEHLRVARDLAQAYTRRIEDHVRAHPEDWAWMHRRWK